MAVKLLSYCLQGLNESLVNVEVDASRGMPFFSIGGMAGKSVQEAKDRVRSAMNHSGFEFPMNRKVVNLSPAEIAKSGSQFDLPIALGLLLVSKQVEFNPEKFLIAGELGLKGEVQPVRGILPILMQVQTKFDNKLKIIIPAENFKEACLIEGLEIFPVRNLKEAVEAACGKRGPAERVGFDFIDDSPIYNFKNVSGHYQVKRALTVAAAGGHHILMKGTPGSGKSILSRSFPSILPPPKNSELLEILKIYSVLGKNIERINPSRPFRTVHHNITDIALVGGERTIGEITMAHNGILFLDELPEFSRSALESLREPLEEKTIGRKNYPCNFQLIAAMNPCPCGFRGDPKKDCECTAYQLLRYAQKISGPILDRIDIQVEVPRLSYDEMKGSGSGDSEGMLETVMEARERQGARLNKYGLSLNQQMSPELIRNQKLDSKCDQILTDAADHFDLSGRSIHKVIKLARTLADLAKKDRIESTHLQEAIMYRIDIR